MTPQEQPDSQAGDELKELREFLRGSFEQFLRSDPSATTSAGCSIAADRAMINVHRAIDHYAERLAAERAVAELSMAVQTSHDYSDVVEVRSILNGRIKQLSATLTKETK